MSLVSVAARNASLAMSYGAGKGSSAPSQLEVALFHGDPANGGVELDSDGGYARVVVDNDGTTWPDAPADGAVTSSAISFATATGAWSDTADCFQIYDASTGDAWDSGRLSDEVSVDTAGTVITVELTVYYNDLGA